MREWAKAKIGEVSLGIYDGPHATPAPCETPGPYFLGIPQISPLGFIDMASPRYIAERDYGAWTKRVVPQYGDVVFSYEATLNLYALIPRDFKCCLGRRMGLVRPNPKKLDFQFLYYYFFSPEWRGTVRENTITGATVDRLSIAAFPNFEIALPPLPIQRRIAAILSNYDSAIDNARRQIALLEEAAMRLYREWFRDGKGEKKRIWEILRHYANGGWGKENSIGKFTECGYVIRGTDIDDLSYGNRSSIPLRVHSKHDIETKRLISGDIIIELSNGNIDNIGRSLLVSDDMLSWFDDVVICASFCKFMRPIDNQMSIALAWHIKYLQSSGKMKVFKNAGANGINNFAFDEFLDSEIQLGDFDSKLFTVLGNMTLQIQTMRSQIRTLTEARDRLLPKLMSGEIEV